MEERTLILNAIILYAGVTLAFARWAYQVNAKGQRGEVYLALIIGLFWFPILVVGLFNAIFEITSQNPRNRS